MKMDLLYQKVWQSLPHIDKREYVRVDVGTCKTRDITIHLFTPHNDAKLYYREFSFALQKFAVNVRLSPSQYGSKVDEAQIHQLMKNIEAWVEFNLTI